MDASSTCGSVSSRVVNVVYFLTRDGRLQQPHLLQIHRLHAHCLHLRDVKKSLSELRGKHLPDAFSWSFKRLYRGGYIWQDVVDDDLILPLSDDEYVLKGSELSNKYVSSSAETVSSGDEQEPKAAATSVKVKAPPPESESESAKEKVVVKIDASMLEERRRKEIAKLQVEKQKPAASSSPWRRVRSLFDVLGCKTTATKDEALRPGLKARRNQQSNRSRCGPNVGDDTAGDNWQPSCRRKGSSPCKAGDAAVFKQSVAMPTTRSDCWRSFKPQHLDSHSKSSSVLHGRNKRGYKKMPTN